MFWEKKNFGWNHEISYWILTLFLSEAVEASLCYFFEIGWWNSNAQTSGTCRYLQYNLKLVFSWPPRSSKYIKASSNTLYYLAGLDRNQVYSACCSVQTVHTVFWHLFIISKIKPSLTFIVLSHIKRYLQQFAYQNCTHFKLAQPMSRSIWKKFQCVDIIGLGRSKELQKFNS